MKDKETIDAIEEMAKVMYGYICEDRPCEECDYHQGSKILEPYCEYYLKAKDLYNAGYRKLPKDSVVLTREEYDCVQKLFTYDKPMFDRISNFVDEIKAQARKETAREFANEIKAYIYDNDHLIEKVDNIAKQFGVEVKE